MYNTCTWFYDCLAMVEDSLHVRGVASSSHKTKTLSKFIKCMNCFLFLKLYSKPLSSQTKHPTQSVIKLDFMTLSEEQWAFDVNQNKGYILHTFTLNLLNSLCLASSTRNKSLTKQTGQQIRFWRLTRNRKVVVPLPCEMNEIRLVVYVNTKITY